MQVDSSYVGAKSAPLLQEVAWRHSMNFAASTSDPNPWYFDDERSEGIIAPPMLSVALTWPYGKDAEKYWDADRFPLHLLVRQVHYTEALHIHRALRPGDKLSLQAELVTLVPHRGGSLLIIRTQAVDESNAPVFTEYAGALLRGVRCTDKGAGAEHLLVAPECASDTSRWEHPIAVDPMAAYLYDGCADIFNPIHTSTQFAKWVGLPGPIVHGTCTLSWAVREVVNREADGDPRRVRSISCRFTGMVMPGSTITIRGLGVQQNGKTTQVFFDVLNPGGKKAISDGCIELNNA